MDENGQINTENGGANNFNNYSQGTFNNKKKGSMIWIIPVILILIIVGVVATVYVYNSKPEQFYKKLITSALESYLGQSSENDDETQENRIKLDVDLKTEEDFIEQDILDLINDINVEIGVQIDKPQKQLVVDLQSDYDGEDLLDLKVFTDSDDKKLYLYAKEFIDKYLEVDLEDESYSEFEDIFETQELSIGQKINLNSGMKIYEKEFTDIIKSEYCSSEKATIKINDKDVKTTKNTIKMTLEQLADGVATAFDNLKQNENFLELIEEEYREEMINLLEENKENVKETIEGQEDASIQLSIYTTGIIQKIVKVEMIVIDEDEEELATISCTKLDDKNYSYEVLSDEEAVIKGTVKLANDEKNKGTIEIETEIEDLGSITINIEYSEESNITVDQIDEENTTKLENLTEQDETEFSQNLEKSKLYELIEKFSGDFSDNDLVEDYDNELIFGNTITSSLQNNQVLTYDNKTMITFGIPAGYTTSRISDNYQTLDKNDVSITISSDYYKEDEYYESLNNYKDSMLQQNYYKNITLSDKESITVGGKTFYHATLKYDYGYSEYTIATDYIWAKVSDNYIVEIEIDEFEQMTREELEQLLTMTISNN